MKVTQVYEGHFDEITKLAVIGNIMISTSLDGTIRRWDTTEPPPALVLEENKEVTRETVGLTEEEERELQELMSDEDL